MRKHIHLYPDHGKCLDAAGTALLEFIDVMHTSPANHTIGQCLAMLDAVKRFHIMMGKAGAAIKPKAHVMCHMPQRAYTEGNPWQHTTWQDKTENREVAGIGGAAYRLAWALRILAAYEKSLSYRPATKRPRR